MRFTIGTIGTAQQRPVLHKVRCLNELELEMTKGDGDDCLRLSDVENTVGQVEQPSHALRSVFPELDQQLSKILEPIGFEAFPFKIGWYNELVGPRFHLDYEENTVALVIISGPDTFERCVMPFVKTQLAQNDEFYCRDPLDDSMKCVFKALTHNVTSAGYDVDTFHDFDMYPSRKPKVLVQTAAHVAGRVEYYHRDRLLMKEPSWCKDWKLFGVAIHPVYGGWFAIRGVLILKSLTACEELKKPERPISGIEEEVIKYLLEEFGSNWKTNKWRDIIPRQSTVRYSQNFIDYLATESDNRWDFVKSIVCKQV